MPLHPTLTEAIKICVRDLLRAVELFDQEEQASQGVPSTFDPNNITDAEIDAGLQALHRDDEEEPCAFCILEALSRMQQKPVLASMQQQAQPMPPGGMAA